MDTATGKTLAKSSQVGTAYLDLVRRFGAGFPGHPRPGLDVQALARPCPLASARRPGFPVRPDRRPP